jgi:hypothetical protein
MIRIISEEPKILNDPVRKRKDKAYQIYLGRKVVAMNLHGTEFKVKSSKPDIHYLVTLALKTWQWSCTCMDFTYYNGECKHITASKYFRHEMGFV